MKRVILFGLSANPPTGLGGHAGLVRWAASARIAEWGDAVADEVWVLPVYRHAFAAKREMAPFAHRLAMARLAFESLVDVAAVVRVLDVERQVHQDPAAPSAPGTIDVVRWLRARNPDVDFALLLGADTYRDLLEGRWKESDALLGLVTVIAVPRKGLDVPVPVRADAPHLDEVSSTAARLDPAQWEQVLQPQVEAYIRANRLYGARDGQVR